MSDRENEMVGEFIINTGKYLFNTSRRIFLGIKKLPKDKKNFYYLGTFTATGMGLFLFKEKFIQMIPPEYVPLKYGLYITPGIPLVYLYELGVKDDKQKGEFDEIFESIGFYGKSKKKFKDAYGNYKERKDYPKFLGKEEDGKKVIYSFYSNMSIDQWENSKDNLENALDCNILKIQTAKKSKKVIKLHTVSSEITIPEKILWDDKYLIEDDGSLVIGENMLEQIKFNLNSVPHVLAAGETGSGKSVALRLMLWQMALKGSIIYMIDFKGGVEFGKQYEQFGEVVTEKDRLIEILPELVKENTERLALFREMEVKNLAEYNNKVFATGAKKLCRIGVFVDEVAEIMDKSGLSKEEKEKVEIIEQNLATLARLSRATGINLFLGMQRPDAKVLTGQIKNNIPVRISGRFADRQASEIVLSNTRATKLPELKGRLLFKVGSDTLEFQAYYFDDEKMLRNIKRDSKEMGGMLTKEDPEEVENNEDNNNKKIKEILIENNDIDLKEEEKKIELNKKIKNDNDNEVSIKETAAAKESINLEKSKDDEYTKPKIVEKNNITYVFASEAEKNGEKHLKPSIDFEDECFLD